jgi:hypothetical protein
VHWLRSRTLFALWSVAAAARWSADPNKQTNKQTASGALIAVLTGTAQQVLALSKAIDGGAADSRVHLVLGEYSRYCGHSRVGGARHLLVDRFLARKVVRVGLVRRHLRGTADRKRRGRNAVATRSRRG